MTALNAEETAFFACLSKDDKRIFQTIMRRVEAENRLLRERVAELERHVSVLPADRFDAFAAAVDRPPA